MSSTLRYRESSRRKNNSFLYRKRGVKVYLYRENGVEKMRITKYQKWGKYRNVNDSEENQQLLQDSIKE